MKILLVYYSYTGNTKMVAEYLQSRINCDILRLEPQTPYSDDYNSVVIKGQEEVNSRFTPKLKNFDVNLGDYDIVILGSPIWWYTFSPVMRSFLTFNDLNGKKIYAFFTNGGYGLGHSLDDLSELGLKVTDYLEVPFEGKKMSKSYQEIDEFVSKIGHH